MTSKRQHIDQTLEMLLIAIGDVPAARDALVRIRDGLSYKAPELMDHMWWRIQDVLVRHAPGHTAAAEIWNTACAQYH